MTRSGGVVVVGSVNVDVSLRAPRIPRRGETVIGAGLQEGPGGKGANQAVAAARCGAAVQLVSAVGDDIEGTRVIEQLESSGVRTHLCVRLVGQPTGRASIWVDPDGDNRILVCPGANARLDSTVVAGQLSSLRGASVLLCQLETPIEGVAAALSWSRRVGAQSILNAAPALSVDALERPPDVLMVNEREARELAASGSDSDAERVVAVLARRAGAGVVVMTLGAAGALVWDRGVVHVIESPRVEAVDSTGAGDAFAGAFAARIAARDAPVAAAIFGCAAGALATLARGALSAMPTGPEVESLLRTNDPRHPGT